MRNFDTKIIEIRSLDLERMKPSYFFFHIGEKKIHLTTPKNAFSHITIFIKISFAASKPIYSLQ